MFSAIRKHMNPATALAFVALVFAITGGAFAATGGTGSSPSHAALTATAAKAKAKAKTKAGPRGPAGPKGATGAPGAAGPAGPGGAQGPQGPAGAKGETGAAGNNGNNGEPGTAGAAGKSVTNTEITPSASNANCKEGGAELKVGSGAATYACNGSPWTDGGTLPAEKTETGVWSFGEIGESAGAAVTEVPISFTIPLAAAPTANYVGPGACVGKSGSELATCQAEQVTIKTACPGSVEEPKAEPGNLCVYETESGNQTKPEGNKYVTEVEGLKAPGGNFHAKAIGTVSKYGGVLGLFTLSEARGQGTWAVTAAAA